MYIVFLVLIVVVCVLLTLTVLAQSPKGGMAANFGVSNQVMGVRQTTDFLEKFTWGLAISLVVFCLAATMSMPSGKISASRSSLERAIQESATGAEGLALPNQMLEFPVQEEGAVHDHDHDHSDPNHVH